MQAPRLDMDVLRLTSAVTFRLPRHMTASKQLAFNMDPSMAISPFLTAADTIILENLLHDVDIGGNPSSETLNDVDQAALDRVIGLSDETSNDFESTVFTGWDIKDLHLPSIIIHAIVQPYVRWAQT